MKELGMALFGTMCIALFFGFKIYPDLEYTGYGSTGSCYGECYEQYVKENGTVVEILQAQKAEAASDPYSSCLLYTSPSPRD